MSPRPTCLLNHDAVALGPGDRGLALHWIRRAQGLPGTKEGCGEGECGACTVLLGDLVAGDRVRYRAVASCLLPVAELPGRHVVTVEGLNPPTGLTPVQQALVDAGAPQCGFCFPGIVMSLTGFLLTSDDLSPTAAAVALDGNVCRCTGYAAIRRATDELCAEAQQRLTPDVDRATALVAWGVLPTSFAQVAERLREMAPNPTAPTADGAPPVLLAGGTDLIIQQPELVLSNDLALVSHRPDLDTVTLETDQLRLGAAVTVEALRLDPDFNRLVPGAADILERFASTIIRNRATVAGNLVNASPIGDLTVLLLALGAELELHGPDPSRRLPLNRFYLGYKQLDLHPGEVVTAVRIPTAVQQDAVSFEKISQRRNLDIASVNSSLRLHVEDGVVSAATLSVGGVAPIPMLATGTAQVLTGQPLTAATVLVAADILDQEIAPIDDVRGSAAYKRLIARRALFAHALRLGAGSIRHEELR